MSNIVISVEKLSKNYRLGQIGTGTFANDLTLWWAKMRGKPNPLLKIGEQDHGNREGDTVWALKDVSFTVEQGEVLGIIGRNGAGKSTLLKILSRVTAPTSGRIRVRGRVASLLEVGTGFHPDLTGRENIYLNGAILGMSRREIDRKFDEIVDFAEVEQFIDTPVKRYSSGMYVRLAFAVAAHLEPEILVVDEVLAVGDAEFQKKCLGKMGDVARDGRTVFFVSHNMSAIMNISNKAVLLKNGQIDVMGAVEEVVQRYDNSLQVADGNGHHIDTRNLAHSGSGEAKIVWAETQNSRGEGTARINMNEECNILFGIENPNRMSLAYAVEILDKNSYPLFHIWSGYEEVERSASGGASDRQVVQVTIPPLQLFPDHYFINLWIGDHVRRYDKVEKCLKIEVLKDFGVKQDLLVTRGRVYKRGSWKVHYPGDRDR